MKKFTSFRVAAVLITIFFFATCTLSTIFAAQTLDSINQKVCTRFEEDVSRMAGIMDELRRRNGITETRVAFGGSDTPIKNADYWINFAAEAIAFERVQKFSSQAGLRSNLQVLAGKVLKAKQEVGNALKE